MAFFLLLHTCRRLAVQRVLPIVFHPLHSGPAWRAVIVARTVEGYDGPFNIHIHCSVLE